MRTVQQLVQALTIVLCLWPVGAAGLEPSLRGGGRPLIGDTVLGMVSGNPVVSFSGDLTGTTPVRSGFSEVPRWIVSDDFDGDGRDEAVVLFAEGTLQFLSLDRGTLRSRSSVLRMSPEAPPTVVQDLKGQPWRGVLGIDQRGDLVTVQVDGGRSTRLASGFSTLTSPISVDLDGNGSSEIAGVNEQGKLTLLFLQDSTITADNTLLPDTRLTAADADGDGKTELFAFSRPSDKFSPGRLGDGLEATAVAAFGWDGRSLSLLDELVLERSDVFECLVPMLAEVEKGQVRILATVTREGGGSWIQTLSYGRKRIRLERKSAPAGGDSLVLSLGVTAIGSGDQSLVLAATDPAGNGALDFFPSDLAITRPHLEKCIATAIPSTRLTGIALIGDFDSDHQRELLAPGKDRKSLLIFELDGNSIRSRELLFGTRAISSNLCPGDYNGDGRDDVMVGFEDGGVVVLPGH